MGLGTVGLRQGLHRHPLATHVGGGGAQPVHDVGCHVAAPTAACARVFHNDTSTPPASRPKVTDSEIAGRDLADDADQEDLRSR